MKITIENLIMRAVFDVLTGKNADPIYTDEMKWEYSVRNKEGQFLVLTKNGVLVCTLNIKRAMTFEKGDINKYFALWSVALAGRFHEEGGFSQPSNQEVLAMFPVIKKGYAKKKPWAYLKSWDWYNEYLYSVKVRFY